MNGTCWPRVRAKPPFRKAAARQFTQPILSTIALFRQCPLTGVRYQA